MQSEYPSRYVRRPQVLDPDPANHVSTRTSQCIRGQIIGTDQHDHLLLKSLLLTWISLISQISSWSIISARHSSHFSGTNTLSRRSNACYLPLRAVSSSRSHLEYIIVRSLADEDVPLTVMQAALVRDCLRGADRGRLDASCWNVQKDEYYAGHGFHKLSGGRALSWKIPTRHVIYQTYT